MSRSHKKHLAAALTACFGALAYTVSKVDLAREGELGMPGFPAPTEAYAAVADVETAQLANAALGLLMAVVALLLVRLPRTPWSAGRLSSSPGRASRWWERAFSASVPARRASHRAWVPPLPTWPPRSRHCLSEPCG